MAGEVIRGESSPAGHEAARLQKMVTDLRLNENKVVMDFAKHLVTLDFSAIGVILALQDTWVDSGDSTAVLWLGGAISLLLVASAISSAAVRASPMKVSGHDFYDVEAEVARVARMRHLLTTLSAVLSIAAIGIAAFVILD